jgi:hypothetical protein
MHTQVVAAYQNAVEALLYEDTEDTEDAHVNTQASDVSASHLPRMLTYSHVCSRMLTSF